MSRIFLDVGSNIGQTIELILSKPQFKIDRIIGFEPSQICLGVLHKKFDNNPKVTICDFGLFSKTCDMILHNSGSQGGSIHADYQTTCNPEKRDDLCHFVEASEWFGGNVSKEDEIFLKLNCEGSECSIVTNLLDSGEYDNVKATLIDFDVRKSPSSQHQEAELRKRMVAMGVDNIHVYMGDNRQLILLSVVR